jgi:hypothetical protein
MNKFAGTVEVEIDDSEDGFEYCDPVVIGDLPWISELVDLYEIYNQLDDEMIEYPKGSYHIYFYGYVETVETNTTDGHDYTCYTFLENIRVNAYD